jgi:hypothetical protein
MLGGVRNGLWVGFQQLPAKRQRRGALAVGEKAEEADANEPTWQGVNQKASQELFRGQYH